MERTLLFGATRDSGLKRGKPSWKGSFCPCHPLSQVRLTLTLTAALTQNKKQKRKRSCCASSRQIPGPEFWEPAVNLGVRKRNRSNLEFRERFWKPSNTAQKSRSATAASRRFLPWERLLGLGTVAPRKVESGSMWRRSPSQTSAADPTSLTAFTNVDFAAEQAHDAITIHGAVFRAR